MGPILQGCLQTMSQLNQVDLRKELKIQKKLERSPYTYHFLRGWGHTSQVQYCSSIFILCLPCHYSSENFCYVVNLILSGETGQTLHIGVSPSINFLVWKCLLQRLKKGVFFLTVLEVASFDLIVIFLKKSVSQLTLGKLLFFFPSITRRPITHNYLF